eukprot:Gb_04677 [translate_table: standard]
MLGSSVGNVLRLSSIKYPCACILRRLLNSAAEVKVIEKYWNVLQNRGSAPNIERALGKIKTQLVSSCVEKVMHKCAENKMLGLRFFIWAGQQPGYRHNLMIYRTVCEVLGIMQQPKMLSQVLKDLRKEGCVVSVKTFKVLLYLCKEANLVEQALELLGHMKEFNCRPDTPIYNILIELLSEAKSMDMTKVMLQQMSQLGLSPDIITYSALIKGFCNVGQIEDAQRIVNEMTAHGCVPNVVTYTTLLSGACKARSPEMALELLDEMLEKQCAPNVVTYTALIQSFCEAGRIKEALEILDRMVKYGCAPNRVTYNTLIKGLCMEGKIDDAYELMEKMIQGGHLLKDQSHNSLVISLLRTNNIEEAEKLFRNMVESGIRPNDLAYNTLIKGLCSVGRYSDALLWGYVNEAAKVLESMADRGIVPEASTFDLVIAHLNKAGKHETVWKPLSPYQMRRFKLMGDWRSDVVLLSNHQHGVFPNYRGLGTESFTRKMKEEFCKQIHTVHSNYGSIVLCLHMLTEHQSYCLTADVSKWQGFMPGYAVVWASLGARIGNLVLWQLFITDAALCCWWWRSLAICSRCIGPPMLIVTLFHPDETILISNVVMTDYHARHIDIHGYYFLTSLDILKHGTWALCGGSSPVELFIDLDFYWHFTCGMLLAVTPSRGPTWESGFSDEHINCFSLVLLFRGPEYYQCFTCGKFVGVTSRRRLIWKSGFYAANTAFQGSVLFQ